jgi:hypothetical protein
MKTSTKFALLFLTILLSACSITPKYHSLGYHIEWKHNFNQKEPRSTTKKIIAENNRESYSIALKSRGLTTPNHGYPKNRTLTLNHFTIGTTEKLAIAEHPATSKQAQQSKYTSYRAVTEYSQTSDTPITTKQLRKLVPNPPMVVKINQQLQAIRVAILVFFTVFGCSFFLFLDGIFGNIYVDFNLVFIGLMISTLLLTILVPLESRLFRRRQKIMNELYVKNPEAIQLLKSLDSLYALLFLIPYLGTPIYHLIRHLTFKKLQSLEPNNPYIELRRRKTKWNVVPGYFSLILTIVSYMVILVL